MADQAYAAGTFYGATVVLTSAATVLSTTQTEKVTLSGWAREAVETTHLLSSGKTFIAGDIIDFGTIDVMTKLSTQLQHVTLMTGAACDTLTITFPKRAVTCGGALAATAASWVFPVIYVKMKPNTDNDKVMTAEHQFRVSGPPTFTPAVV